MARMTAQDMKWQAESDARTLSDAAEISSDKKRMAGATSAANRMASEQEKSAKNMRKVAKRSVKVTTKKPVKKAAAKKPVKKKK